MSSRTTKRRRSGRCSTTHITCLGATTVCLPRGAPGWAWWCCVVPPPPKTPQPSRQVPASTAFVTDSNRPQPLRQPPPTACPTASGAASWKGRGPIASLGPGASGGWVCTRLGRERVGRDCAGPRRHTTTRHTTRQKTMNPHHTCGTRSGWVRFATGPTIRGQSTTCHCAYVGIQLVATQG